MGFWTPSRIRLYSRAAVGAIVLAFVITTLGAGPGRIGGDFPAFYGAGRIVLEGEIPLLYDHQRLAASQRDLFPSHPAAYIYFPYPPFFAVPYAVLALLPFQVAYAIHVMVMTACLGIAVVIASRALRLPSDRRLAAFACALTFYPLFRAVGGGQNTALSLLIIVAALSLGERRRDFWAGVVLGVLWFKPQYAVTFVGVWALERRFRAVLGAVAAAAVYFAIGTAMAGPAWPLWWWRDAVLSYKDYDQAVNATNAVSWLGFTEALFGVGTPVALIPGYTLGGLTALLLGTLAIRGRSDHWSLGGLASVACVLMSPHAMFYDAGLAALPLLLAFTKGMSGDRAMVVAIWAVSLLHPLNQWLGVTPVFAALVGAFCLAVRHAVRSPASDAPR